MLTYDDLSIRRIESKSPSVIAAEWDRIALARHKQIVSGNDLSFNHVLMPTVVDFLQGCDLNRVIDLGCGTGELTGELARVSGEVSGVDLSPLSIEIAEETCCGTSNITFHATTVEGFAKRWTGQLFTTAVANMTLMTCLDLDSFVKAAAKLVAPKGHLISTITHPWFWPNYWGYDNADWFNYHREVVIEAPFRISAEITEHVTTHVHRPLSVYLNSLTRQGFLVDRILEPYPNEDIQALYPERWKFPRFLAFRALLCTT